MKKWIALLLAITMMMSCVSFAGAEETAVVVDETPEAVEAVTEPVVEEPAAEEPVAEEPVVDEPVADEPAADEPVAEEPVTEEPAAEEPAAEEPVAEESASEEPASEEPVAEEPASEEPAAEEEESIGADDVETADEYLVADITAIDNIDHDDIQITIEYCDNGEWREASWDDRIADAESIPELVRVNISITSRNGALARTDSDYDNIQVRLSDSHGWAGYTYVKLKEFTEQEKDNGEVVYTITLPYPKNLIVFGPLDLDVRVDDTVSGAKSDWNDASGVVCTKAPEVTTRVDGTTVYADVSFLHGANVLISDLYLMQWDEASGDYVEVDKVHEPWDGQAVFRNVTAGDRYIIKATESYQGVEAGQFYVDGLSEELQVGDWTEAPKITLKQTAAGQVNLSIDGKAATYAVQYHVGDDKATTVTLKNGDNTLKKLGSSGTLYVMVTPTANGQTSSESMTAALDLISWGWAAKPAVTVTQDVTAEAALTIRFNDYAYPAYVSDGEDLEIHYLVTVGETEYDCLVIDDEKTPTLTTDGTSSIGYKSGSYWYVTVPYPTDSTGKLAVTVTPAVHLNQSATDYVLYTGAAGSASYSCSKFNAAAWKLAPTAVQQPLDCNCVSYKVTLNGGATDGFVKVDSTVYVFSEQTEATNGVKTEMQSDGTWLVRLTFGMSAVSYGKHSVSFAAMDPGADDTKVADSGTYTKAVKVTINEKPDWASKKMTVKATQLDDTHVQLTFTNLGTDSTAGLKYYMLTVKGDHYENSKYLYFEDVKKSGSSLVYTYEMTDTPAYDTTYTFDIHGTGFYYNATTVDTRI